MGYLASLTKQVAGLNDVSRDQSPLPCLTRIPSHPLSPITIPDYPPNYLPTERHL